MNIHGHPIAALPGARPGGSVGVFAAVAAVTPDFCSSGSFSIGGRGVDSIGRAAGSLCAI